MKNLIALRKSKGLTQNDMAIKLQVSKPTYNHYEKGKYEPDIQTLIQLADYFGCSVDYLLGHETKGIVHLDSYTPLQQEVISKLRLLDEDQLFVLSNYIDTINGKPLSEILANAKKK